MKNLVPLQSEKPKSSFDSFFKWVPESDRKTVFFLFQNEYCKNKFYLTLGGDVRTDFFLLILRDPS